MRDVAIDPDNELSWYELGILHQSSGAVADAAACFTRCLDLAGWSETTGNSIRNYALRRLAKMTGLPEGQRPDQK